ncbi:MAG: hypothetical protein ACI9ON_000402 [Limisphaerales bacterium]|jgi:hypothetical protein
MQLWAGRYSCVADRGVPHRPLSRLFCQTAPTRVTMSGRQKVSKSIRDQIRYRRMVGFLVIGLLLTLDIAATGVFGGGERLLAVLRTVVLPGLPFLEWHPLIGVATIMIVLTALGTWLRWGMDWLVMLVMLVSVAVALFVMPLHHQPAVLTAFVVEASHEFMAVLVIFTLIAQLRVVFARLPGSGWVRARLPKTLFFPSVDRARAATIRLLHDSDCQLAREMINDPRMLQRAAMINRIARCRFSGDVLRSAHAPLRAARNLAGLNDVRERQRWLAESRSSLAGVPDSEPTWVRLLDGVLTALAIARLDESTDVERWRQTLDVRFALRHGRRPSALHTPSMLSLGTADAWEHAAATALAHAAGWIDQTDWTYLRPRCLGAAASGKADPASLRLVAAGKIWAKLTADTEALLILERRTLEGDPLACALNDLVGSDLVGSEESAGVNSGRRER